jgi:1-acyl-sn-glycerol-3-phosphate acyltransferase
MVADGERLRRPLLKWLFLLPRLIFKLWFMLVFALSLVLLYIPFRVLLRKPSRYPRAFMLMRFWGGFLGFFMLMPIRVKREGMLPPPPYVVCINHSSYLDIVHTFNVVPDYFLFMGKYELLKWPLFNIFFKDMHIAVNRGSRTEAARALMKAGRAIDLGVSVSIFPEATIPQSSPRMKTFKDGAFRLAIEKQVPIVPITFLDNWRLLGDPEKWSSRGHPGIARAVVHPPVPTKGLAVSDIDALRRHVFDIIEAPLRAEYPGS